MHIPDGILPPAVAIGGYGMTGAVTWYLVRQIDRDKNHQENIPKASLLTAAFFVASSIHIPVPPASVHLVLNGLLGAVLGYYAFPAILVGLFFQAVMFQHGGLSTLGINAILMGVPALIAGYVFRIRELLGPENRLWTGVFGFLAGAIGVGLAASIFFSLIITNIPADIDVQAEKTAIYALILAHIPLMAIEGMFTAMVALFLERVKPEMLRS
jgi:cobalt/nickel transport system permease protein